MRWQVLAKFIFLFPVVLFLNNCSLLTSGLQVAGEVEGRVVDIRTREPIAGAIVTSERVGKSRKTKTNRDGSFRLRPLLTYTKDPSLFDISENHIVKVSATGYVSTTRNFYHPLEEGARPPKHRGLVIPLRKVGNALPTTMPRVPTVNSQNSLNSQSLNHAAPREAQQSGEISVQESRIIGAPADDFVLTN